MTCCTDERKKAKAESMYLSRQTPGERLRKVGKGTWRMPRLSEARKDVISCEKPR